ncbi:hypothetical protein BDA96_09G112400 [Sorghum bicolor]|jgi:hypothetical protein|uniref:Uncharacterized protein n=2 Tax=Sorghum bicolor TaxID=4558 RepID=A0A921U4E8_SORBI|nr:hypothetical protein BDA96_09G112400 [Sorghum bicolor]KXG21784.1 hypothetical protein SORBI_3009G107600 [Sorghum bicolor]
MSDSSEKSAWPEVKGLPAEVAKHKILADRRDVQVVALAYGTFVTTEFNNKRVRVFFNEAGNVAEVPKIG